MNCLEHVKLILTSGFAVHSSVLTLETADGTDAYLPSICLKMVVNSHQRKGKAISKATKCHGLQSWKESLITFLTV